MANRRRYGQITAPFALALVLVMSASAGAQSGGQSATLEIETRVVNVNVVVTDAAGHPLTDLTEDDFTILDGKQPQQIAFFSAINNEEALSSVPALPPDTYTNRPVGYGAPQNVTVLLFDTTNSGWVSQAYGLWQICRFLRRVKPQDHLGIYVLGHDLKVLHDFTQDASDLVAAIHRRDQLRCRAALKPAALKQVSASEANLLCFLCGRYYQFHFPYYTDPIPHFSHEEEFVAASEMTTAALGAIARQLSTVEGRKTLIWVADEVGPMEDLLSDNMNETVRWWRGQRVPSLPSLPSWENGFDHERLARLMNDAGISVYAMSANGYWAYSPMADLDRRTGGRAYYGDGGLDSYIQRALDDSRFSYELAYYPNHNKWKGEWRKIEVKVNRPKVRVLARGGYYALPDPVPMQPKSRVEFLSSVAASPINSAELPLRVHTAAVAGTTGPEIDASVHLDPLPMLTRGRRGHWRGNFEVVFMQLGDKNRFLDVTQKSVEADLNAKEYMDIAQNGWDLEAKLKFMPGAELLCVILHDQSTDEVGSVRIPLARYAAVLAAH